MKGLIREAIIEIVIEARASEIQRPLLPRSVDLLGTVNVFAHAKTRNSRVW